MKEVRPTTVLPWGWPERVLSGVAWLAQAGLIGVLVWAWPRLPAVIPIHFGGRGEPDGYDDRAMLLWLPVVAIGLHFVLTVLAMAVRLGNFPWPITPENAARQYRLARGLALHFRAVLGLVLLYAVTSTVSVALGYAQGISPLLVFTLLGGIPLGVVGYFIAAIRAR